MSDRPMKLIVNAATGEETLLPLTDEEIAERESKIAKYALEEAKVAAAEAQKQANKESAKSKLEALGLSADEINALIG